MLDSDKEPMQVMEDHPHQKTPYSTNGDDDGDDKDKEVDQLEEDGEGVDVLQVQESRLHCMMIG